MSRRSVPLLITLVAGSCPRDVVVVQERQGQGPMSILDVESNQSLGTLLSNMDTESTWIWPFAVRVASSGKIVANSCNPESETYPCEPVGVFWSANGTNLREVPGFVLGDADFGNNGNFAAYPIGAARVFTTGGEQVLSKDQASPSVVSIRDLESFDALCELAHASPVRAASFDVSGSRVLTVEKSGEVATWSAESCSVLVRIAHAGNASLGTGSGSHGSVAWAARDTLVAIIESDVWYEPVPGDEPIEHYSSRLAVYDAATGRQVHATNLGEILYRFELFARGDVIVVAGNGARDLTTAKIFNASNGALLQDFTSRDFSNHSFVDLVDVDPQGEHLVVSSGTFISGAPRKTDVDGIWDVATGELGRALWQYKHNAVKGFSGAGRIAVEKYLRDAHRRTQIVDLETDRMVASALGVAKAYGTVTQCDDASVLV